jgi:predicted nucleic acid-binding protein
LILLDTSAWITYLKKGWPQSLNFERIVTCPPIIQELLQGVRDQSVHNDIRESLLNLPILSNPVLLEMYLRAGNIYRLGRKRGITIRSSMDCLISAIAIENEVSIMHCDRDFESISQFTELSIQEFISV